MNREKFSPVRSSITEGFRQDQILIGPNEIIITKPGSEWHPKPEKPAPKPSK